LSLLGNFFCRLAVGYIAVNNLKKYNNEMTVLKKMLQYQRILTRVAAIHQNHFLNVAV
jgi:hypothetical protein